MKPTFNLNNIDLKIGDTNVRVENIKIELGEISAKDAVLLAKEVPLLLYQVKKEMKN